MSLKLLVRSLTPERHDKFWMFYRRLYSNDSGIINDPVSRISLFHIKQVLKQKNINTIDGHACLVTECPICNSEKSKKANIYINKTTGKERYIR